MLARLWWRTVVYFWIAAACGGLAVALERGSVITAVLVMLTIGSFGIALANCAKLVVEGVIYDRR